MQIGLESERGSVVTPKPYTWIHFSEYATNRELTRQTLSRIARARPKNTLTRLRWVAGALLQ
jgi:hypothetical protein